MQTSGGIRRAGASAGAVAGVWLGVLLASCAGPAIKKGQAPGSSGPTALQNSPADQKRDYKDILTLYSKGAFESALGRAQSFQRKYPKSGLVPAMSNIIGLSYLGSRRPQMAIPEFKKAIDANPRDIVFNQYIMYNLAAGHYEAGQIEDASQVLAETNSELLDTENRVKFLTLRARVYEKKSLPIEASRALLDASRYLQNLDSRDFRASFSKQLEQDLQRIADVDALESLYHDYGDSPVVDVLIYRIGSQQMAMGKIGSGESYLRALMERFPESAYYAQAAETLNAARDSSSVSSRSVGVLLPLTGKFAPFGQRTLMGIQMAFGVFGPAKSSGVTLVVEDSGEEMESTLKALNRLVFKHHVVAVMGPLLSKGIDQVSQRAQELGVPLISLARLSGPPMDYVFQGGLTLQMQAQQIARFAMHKLGFRRFAMVYPSDRMGNEISQHFWNAVEADGGKIVGAEPYAPGETDFRLAVDRLSALAYPDARARELEVLSRERELNNVKRRTRKTEKFFALPPVVDYDAVFVPDEARMAGQILPTFAYRDVEGVKFLGTSSWNSPEFLTRVHEYASSSYFVDAYFPDAQKGEEKAYSDRFKSEFGQDSKSMDAMAYDAALVLEAVLAVPEQLTRADVKERLRVARGVSGVTGRITVRDNQFDRDLKVLTVKSGKIIEQDS